LIHGDISPYSFLKILESLLINLGEEDFWDFGKQQQEPYSNRMLPQNAESPFIILGKSQRWRL